MATLHAVVAESWSGSHAVLRHLFGVDDPASAGSLLQSSIVDHCGADVVDVWLWHVGNSCVAGVVLTDDRELVVKVARPPVNGAVRMAQVHAVQRDAHQRGLPVPALIGDVRPIGPSWMLTEERCEVGRPPDMTAAADRQATARGWWRLTHALRHSAAGQAMREVNLRADRGLYPPAVGPQHALPMAADGAGSDLGRWIDNFARVAADLLERTDGDEPTAVHIDWHGGNLRVDDRGDEVTAIYDWNSIVRLDLHEAIGVVAAAQSACPGATAVDAVCDYAAMIEAAAGHRFSSAQWQRILAAALSTWCYRARVELAVGLADPTWSSAIDRLREGGQNLLARATARA